MKNRSFFPILLLFLSLAVSAQNKGYKELMSQDWPNLKEYREANKKIKASTKYPTVVFMGNSIVKGWVNKHPEFFKSNDYVGRV